MKQKNVKCINCATYDHIVKDCEMREVHIKDPNESKRCDWFEEIKNIGNCACCGKMLVNTQRCPCWED